MRIVADEEKGTWTFIPVTNKEFSMLAKVAGKLDLCQKLKYRNMVSRKDGSIAHLEFEIGPADDEKSKPDALILRGIGTEDKNQLASIRNTCFFGPGGLIYLGVASIEGVEGVVFTGEFCKVCGRDMIGLAQCETLTCHDCASKCEHQYKRGAFHGGEVDIGVADVCTKCGRVRPRAEGESELTLAQHHQNVRNELGVKIHYIGGP